MTKAKRGGFGSSLGFILASAGAAVGLGNIQRFPYIVAESGGSAFIFLYLIAVVILAVPLMLVEFAIGRHTQRNPVCAIEKIKPGSKWKWAGALGIFTAFFILSYYSVMGGWAISFVFTGAQPSKFGALGFMVLFFTICIFVVMQGIHKGIEKLSKVLMPCLLVILIVLVCRALTLPGAEAGLKFYLVPDFSSITPRVVLLALSQAFFSLCIGEAVLVTYGSYAPKKENLFASAGYIGLFDTVVAVLAGLVIFPALFAVGQVPSGDVTLTFDVLPKLFASIPFGNFFSLAFFILLAFAALTTGVALLEIPVIWLIDSRGWKRKKATLLVGLLAFAVGIPSAFSLEVYRFMDLLWGGFGMIVCGGLLALFGGYVWGVKGMSDELKEGCDHFEWYQSIFGFTVKYIAPTLILLILLFFFMG
ncbi:MAG: hypothetical protein SP1CHLAM54_11460 [Chlamydiia bacterium]|nr:hypothetical protein [Chlamydiia bacterium]MCH9616049.1 hypothetical protein [Chlamydiia bacterium]MCH9629072.1 hypothetical protein [Chlamydiia bacterium]